MLDAVAIALVIGVDRQGYAWRLASGLSRIVQSSCGRLRLTELCLCAVQLYTI
jgi:hypothetical protein